MLKVEGNFTVTGPLETFANASGIHVARALLAEFAQNMAALLATEGDAAPEAATTPIVELETPSMRTRHAVHPTAPAAELHAGSLLWRSFFGRLRQVFSGKGQQ